MSYLKKIGLLLIAAILLAACSPTSSTPKTDPSVSTTEKKPEPLKTEEVDAEHARALMEKALKLVNDKDTEGLKNIADDELKERLTDANVKALYAQVDSFGAFQKINDTREAGIRTKEGKLHIVVAGKAQYEKVEAQYTFAFNEDDTLTSVNVKQPDSEQ